MRLFARGGDDRDGDFARSPAEIRRFARAYRDRNVYVAPNPTSSTGGSRHSAKDVTHWSYFLIDMDPVCSCPPDRAKKKLPKCDTCRGKAEPLLAVEEALLRLGEWIGQDFKRTRPIILDSGRGAQAWVRLGDVVLDDITPDTFRPALARTTARRVNGYWLKLLDKYLGVTHGCRIDTSVSDLPRVMRCPGTSNLKTGRVARFINATDHVFFGVAHLLVVGTPEGALVDPPVQEGIEAGLSWQMVFSHLTLSAQEYLTRGREEPGRHKVMWHTARKFEELGVSRAEARRALRWANRLAGKVAELPRDQVEHALDTAYGR